MLATITHQQKTIKVDLNQPLDISIPLRAGKENVNAWYVGDVKIEPVVSGSFIGDVNKGGTVNFRNITFNPHGHGTHTECVGHISKEWISINQEFKQFFFIARLITVDPVVLANGDNVITLVQLKGFSLMDKNGLKAEAIIIRTLPNTAEKLRHQYSNTNPPYMEGSCAAYLLENGIDHLLIDLPSVDREVDNGVLAMHHGFWQYPQQTNKTRTITEFIFVDNTIADDFYLLNLQIASFENDATPSKPVLYKLI